MRLLGEIFLDFQSFFLKISPHEREFLPEKCLSILDKLSLWDQLKGQNLFLIELELNLFVCK